MCSPRIAVQLRQRGHDVVALVVDVGLRAVADPDVHEWAAERGRRVVAENVRDFRTLTADGHGSGVLFASSRSFRRSAARCTAATTGRTISVGPYEEHLVRARAEQPDPAWREDYRATHPEVERKIGQLMRRRHGGRRARVRGQDKIEVAEYAEAAIAGCGSARARCQQVGVRMPRAATAR